MRTYLFSVLVVVSCSHPARKDLGVLSPEAEAALREWCPDLKTQSKTAAENADSTFPNVKGKATTVLDCPGAKGKLTGERERGSVEIDAKTRQLLNASLFVTPDSFDILSEKVLLPALDDEADAALKDVRAALDAKAGSKDWRRAGIYVLGRVMNAEMPLWNIGVGPDLSK